MLMTAIAGLNMATSWLMVNLARAPLRLPGLRLLLSEEVSSGRLVRDARALQAVGDGVLQPTFRAFRALSGLHS